MSVKIYATPLSKLTEEVETLTARVDEHLKRMEKGKLRMENAK
jgi:hypothetical protein